MKEHVDRYITDALAEFYDLFVAHRLGLVFIVILLNLVKLGLSPLSQNLCEILHADVTEFVLE